MTDADLLKEIGRLKQEHAAIRRETLEEAASLVESFVPKGDDHVSSVSRSSLKHAAFALRFLKVHGREAEQYRVPSFLEFMSNASSSPSEPKP